MKGACRCGSVTYALRDDVAAIVYVCHCLNCQTWSGSAFAEHAMIPADALTLAGDTIGYHHESDGIRSEQVLCSTCFTRLYNSNAAAPGMVILRAGTLTDSEHLTPAAHIWTRRKQPWVVIPAGVPSWPETPTPEQFGAAIAGAQ